jgi:hypothetical protein
MFGTYMGTAEMNATIVDIAGTGGYRIAPRFNPGSSLPSDFAVIVVRKCLAIKHAHHHPSSNLGHIG